MRSSACSRRRVRARAFPRTVRSRGRSYGTLGPLRRALLFLACSAALLVAAPAGARLEPVRHDGPRVRRGMLPAHTGPATRLRVVVDLRPAPLAVWHARQPASTAARTKLDVASASSRAYLRALVRAQARAVVQLRDAIPQARVSRRFQVVLDALTVSLPAERLPTLAKLPFVAKVYPS